MQNQYWSNAFRCVFIVALIAASSSCGSGSAILAGSSSSGSNAPEPLTIIGRDPKADEVDAEPVLEIDITFNRDIDSTSVGVGTGSILLYAGDPAMGATDIFDVMVDHVEVDETEVKLVLAEPMQLETRYFFVIPPDLIRATNSQLFAGTSWKFDIRSGDLSEETLVSFLAPIGRIAFRDPDSGIPGTSGLDSIAVIEGTDISATTGEQDGFVIAVAGIRGDNSVQNPDILFRSGDIELQTKLGDVFVAERGLTSISFTGNGKTFCSGSKGRMPNKNVYVSQFVDDGASQGDWDRLEADDNIDQIDTGSGGVQSTSPNNIGWEPGVAVTDTGDTVAVYWQWTDFDTSSEDFATWSIYSSVRDGSTHVWAAPTRIDTGAPTVSAWPFLLKDPAQDRIYAVWGQASVKADIYGKQGTGSMIDDATLDSYQLAIYESGAWSAPIGLILPGQKLGRPTSMVIDDQGRIAVFSRSSARGLVAVTFDARATTPALLGEDALPLTSPIGLVDDGFQLQPCGNFNANERYLVGGIPRSSAVPVTNPSQSVALVTWIEANDITSGARVVEIWATEFDLANGIWDPTKTRSISGPIAQQIATTDFGLDVAAPELDSRANAYVTWTVVENTGNEFEIGGFFAARRAGGALDWLPVDSMAQDFRVSEAGRCPFTGDLTAIHPSGQAVFAWTEADCPGGETVRSSVLRRFE